MSTNFLWYPGNSSSGLLTSAITVLSSETAFNSIASGATALSTVVNGTGIVTSSTTLQAVFGDVFLTLGGTVGTAFTAGANLTGWFMTSLDGGTTFENYVSGSALSRPPDFIIPLPATTITSSGWTYKAAGLVRLPALQFKVMVQNNSGQTFPSSGNLLRIAPVAVQY